jgi:hypothetical protein
MPAATIAAERAWLGRLGLRVPAFMPGAAPGDVWIAPSAWFARGSGRRRIKISDLRADLPWLCRMLREGYAGWSTARRRGWDWEDFFRKWDRHLGRVRARFAAVEKAFAPWREFLAFLPDGHTGPLARLGFARGSQTLIVAAGPGGEAAEAQMKDGSIRALRKCGMSGRLWRVKTWRRGGLQPGAMISLPAAWGPVRRVRVGREWKAVSRVPAQDIALRGRAIAALSGSPACLPAFRRLPRGVDYIRIPSLTSKNAKSLVNLARRLKSRGTTRAALIVDLRQNTGGDHTAALAALRALLPGIAWGGKSVRRRRINSPMARALRWGYVQGRLREGPSRLTPDQRRAAQGEIDRIADLPAAGVHFRGDWLVLPVPIRGSRDGGPMILILADERCASDGELLVWMLRRLPFALVAGSCTHGAAQFIQPGDGLLPRTGVAFRVATAETRLDGRAGPMDGQGMPVDIVLADGRCHGRGSILALVEELLRKRPV